MMFLWYLVNVLKIFEIEVDYWFWLVPIRNRHFDIKDVPKEIVKITIIQIYCREDIWTLDECDV